MKSTATGRTQETTIRLLLLLGLIVCLLVTSSHAFTLYNLERYPYIHTVAKKRGNMDLAFIQMYQLCDLDRNGLFSPRELQCLNDMLRLLIGVSNK